MKVIGDPRQSDSDEGDMSGLPSSWAANTSKPESSKRHRWLIPVLVAAGLVISGAAIVTYRTGVSNAYAHGHEVGYGVGHTDGYSEGNSDGYDNGKDDGYTTGHTAGYAEGNSDGHKRGLVVGRKDGFANGYSAGTNGGYSQGWSAGCRAVFTTLGDTTAAAWSDVDCLGYDPSFATTVSEFSC